MATNGEPGLHVMRAMSLEEASHVLIQQFSTIEK